MHLTHHVLKYVNTSSIFVSSAANGFGTQAADTFLMHWGKKKRRINQEINHLGYSGFERGSK